MVPDMPRPRGLANLPPERRQEIARSGGKATKPHKRAFSKDPELARQAGQRGAEARAAKRAKPPAAP